MPSGVIDSLASHLPEVRRIELESSFYADDGDWIESLLVTSGNAFDPEAALESLSRVELFHHELVSYDQADQQVCRLIVTAHEPYPFLLGLILRSKAIPNRLVLSQSRFDGVITAAEWEDFRSLADRIQEQFGWFELLSINQVETTGEPLGSGRLGRVVRNELSRDQLVVLRTAHEMGYFDTPRRTSADEVASKLGIAQSTFSERMRSAENELFDLVFSADEDNPETDEQLR